MPYIKDIGRSPVYIARYISRPKIPYLDIPHKRIGDVIIFKDIYEAHVLELERMNPYMRRFLMLL